MTTSNQSAAATNILVIDDDPDILATVAFALEQVGYEVSTANNGEAGLTLAYQTRPSLMVVDMMMPKRSGFLVIESLRKDYSEPIKIIMMTANEGERHESYADLLGVDTYLHKPFSMELLVQRVNELLS
jgi:DNA-binding response OmpR family regulator